MAEWLKAHAWKACVGNTTVGSNPTLSASSILGEIFQWIKRLLQTHDTDKNSMS